MNPKEMARSRLAHAVASLLLCVVTLLMVGCQTKDSEFIEKLRLPSPDRRVDAVLGERATDATVATVSEVHVVPKEQKIGPSTLVLRSDNASGMKVVWPANNMLIVEYRRARIFQFTNFWQSKEVDNFAYTVEIRLKPTE